MSVKVVKIGVGWRSKYPHLKTKTELRKMKLRPRANVKPRGILGLNTPAGYQEFDLYDDRLTRPNKLTNAEKIRLKNQRVEQKRERDQKRIEAELDYEEKCRKWIDEQRERESYALRTSWQWLYHYCRIPTQKAKPERIDYGMGKAWFYYYKKDTVVVSDKVFEKLKALYVKKFGGWEQINLEHTRYSGKIWWTEEDLGDLT